MNSKSILLSIITALTCFSAVAQCPAGRYLTDMFSTSVTTVTYSTPYSLLMDIYQPTSDPLPARPLIVLAHGGSFVAGSRTDDPTVDSLCVRFARRGYVVASIDYRLGSPLSLLDSAAATDVVIKAISDGKAAIRYFVKDAATTNTYKIDTNNIFIGGNSAGAVLYMHVGYLTDISECPANIAAAMSANGGFEGNSGNAGYTTKSKAIINLAGALNQASMISTGDKPSMNAHGTTDDVVPYNCGYPLGGAVRVNLCGLGTLAAEYSSKSIYNYSMIFTGDAHVPWNSDLVKMNSVDSATKEFLYTLVCPTSTRHIAQNATTVNLYPNPAKNQINVSATAALSNAAIYNTNGQLIVNEQAHNTYNMLLNTNHLPHGIYLIKLQFTDGTIEPVTKTINIQ